MAAIHEAPTLAVAVDGIPDSTDPDSDGDSEPDAEEGSVDSIPTDATDANSNGGSILGAEQGSILGDASFAASLVAYCLAYLAYLRRLMRGLPMGFK